MPNITGSMRVGAYKTDAYSQEQNGSLYQDSVGRTVGSYESGSNTKTFLKICFDASTGETKTDGTLKTSSEHIAYGSSDYVTPKNTTIKLWKRIN